jgi:catecholate siderophore receptor
VTLTGELEGQRPSMTPRHSGSLFTTYQVRPELRLGAGLNARSPQTPNRNPPGIVAPGFVTYDLFAEYAFTPQVLAKITFLNITNKLYADSLYTAHYIAGQPRTLFASLTARF